MAAEAAALKQKLFMKHPSIFIVSDGRLAASHRAITSALLKASRTTHGEVAPPVRSGSCTPMPSSVRTSLPPSATTAIA